MNIGDTLESKRDGNHFKVMEVFESLNNKDKLLVRLKRKTKTGKRIFYASPNWLVKNYKKVDVKKEE